ncbi:MAG TPA: hypothetical protein VF970_05230 [Gemmatimonadales bacterium]
MVDNLEFALQGIALIGIMAFLVGLGLIELIRSQQAKEVEVDYTTRLAIMHEVMHQLELKLEEEEAAVAASGRRVVAG